MIDTGFEPSPFTWQASTLSTKPTRRTAQHSTKLTNKPCPIVRMCITTNGRSLGRTRSVENNLAHGGMDGRVHFNYGRLIKLGLMRRRCYR